MSDDEWDKEKKGVARKWLVDNMDAIVDEMYLSLPKEPHQLKTYRLDSFDVDYNGVWDISFWSFVGAGSVTMMMHEKEIRQMIYDLAVHMGDQHEMLETLTKAYGTIMLRDKEK